MTNWSSLLDSFGRELLRELGEDPDRLPTSYNPITRALKLPTFIQQIQNKDGFSRRGLARVATLCQMVVYDAKGGPDEDGKPKGHRRHWYAWFKGEFAQPFALQLGDFTVNAQGVEELNDTKWDALKSTTYAYYVDTGKVTYEDMWVADTSRRKKRFWSTLFRGLHVLVAVEKDSLFEDFFAASQALGVEAIYSGKGKSSKAGIEDLLRKHYSWAVDYSPFTEENPLYVLAISDWDYDGEQVIGPTFGEQARRYTPHVREARVGINPENVEDAGFEWEDRWYRVKISNSSYRTWAEEKALFLAECSHCEHRWAIRSIYPDECPDCGFPDPETVTITADTPAHGFEVEALTTQTYYRLLVEALLTLLPFETIVARLRDECFADAEDAARKVRQTVLDNNEDYQRLQDEFKRLNAIKSAFEQEVQEALKEKAKPHVHDWRDDDRDPTPEQLKRYVERAKGHTQVWRPFDPKNRTAALIKWLRVEGKSTIDVLTKKRIEF